MPRTPAGHFRRIPTASWMATPADRRSSFYGYVTNYRTREAVAGLPTGLTVEPLTGDAPLTIDADASALVPTPILGRGQFPGDSAASSHTRRSGPAALLTLAVAARTRRSPDAAVDSSLKALFQFSYDPPAGTSLEFGDVEAAAHEYVDPGTYQVRNATADALGRFAEQTPIEVVATVP